MVANTTTAIMSAIFRSGSLWWRGSPALSPSRAKSNVTAVQSRTARAEDWWRYRYRSKADRVWRMVVGANRPRAGGAGVSRAEERRATRSVAASLLLLLVRPRHCGDLVEPGQLVGIRDAVDASDTTVLDDEAHRGGDLTAHLEPGWRVTRSARRPWRRHRQSGDRRPASRPPVPHPGSDDEQRGPSRLRRRRRRRRGRGRRVVLADRGARMAARKRSTASRCSVELTGIRGRRAATWSRARWAIWRTAAGDLPTASAISS